MKTKLGIVGAAGRMGQNLINASLSADSIKLTAAVECKNHPAIGQDSGELAGVGHRGVEISDSLEAVIDQIDVLIDFTRPQPSIHHLQLCRQFNKRIVIGTTGFDRHQRQLIDDAGNEIALVLAPNMSVGVNLTLKLLELAAQVMGHYTDIEIIEAHHRYKVDAPSGTALRMGEVVANTLKRNLSDCAIYGRQGNTGERDANTIGFSTIRAGDIVGEHTVMFADEGERVEITHKATSRITFANGAMRAVAWIMSKDVGLFDMQDVLGLKDK